VRRDLRPAGAALSGRSGIRRRPPSACNSWHNCTGSRGEPSQHRDEGYRDGSNRGYRAEQRTAPMDFPTSNVSLSSVMSTATNLLFAGSREGYCYALDAASGKLLCQSTLGGEVKGPSYHLRSVWSPIYYCCGGHDAVHLRSFRDDIGRSVDSSSGSFRRNSGCSLDHCWPRDRLGNSPRPSLPTCEIRCTGRLEQRQMTCFWLECLTAEI
jgi:hypothetical protein